MKLKAKLVGRIMVYIAFLSGVSVFSWFGGTVIGKWIMEAWDEIE